MLRPTDSVINRTGRFERSLILVDKLIDIQTNNANENHTAMLI